MFRLAAPLAVLLVIWSFVRWRSKRTGKTHSISWLPKGGADAIAQLAIFVGADILYETVRGVAGRVEGWRAGAGLERRDALGAPLLDISAREALRLRRRRRA